MQVHAKPPGARLDYAIDWAASVASPNIITVSSWTVSPVEAGGVTVDASVTTQRVTTATVSGGLAGATYDLTNRITLSDGQIAERSLSLRVEQL